MDVMAIMPTERGMKMIVVLKLDNLMVAAMHLNDTCFSEILNQLNLCFRFRAISKVTLYISR